jgi:hypothetical protein
MAKTAIQVLGAALACAMGSANLAVTVLAESVVWVGMSAGDIPDWTGQPDQGFEGFRFVGWTLHDSFINWDLSRSDREAPLTGGLGKAPRSLVEVQDLSVKFVTREGTVKAVNGVSFATARRGALHHR